MLCFYFVWQHLDHPSRNQTYMLSHPAGSAKGIVINLKACVTKYVIKEFMDIKYGIPMFSSMTVTLVEFFLLFSL